MVEISALNLLDIEGKFENYTRKLDVFEYGLLVFDLDWL